MEQAQIWNYEQEVKKIEGRTTTDKLKLDEGFHLIKILTEPTNEFYTDEAGNITEQIALRVLVNNKEYVWYIPKGLTEQSAYYKLMYIGRHYRGLMGITLKTNVTKSKNRDGRETRRYDFLNYLEIKSKEVRDDVSKAITNPEQKTNF